MDTYTPLLLHVKQITNVQHRTLDSALCDPNGMGVRKRGETDIQTADSGEGNGSPLQDSGLESSLDRGAWRATVYGGRKEMQLSTHKHTQLTHSAAEKKLTHTVKQLNSYKSQNQQQQNPHKSPLG